MSMTTPNRVAAGVPTGGQFAASARAEAPVALAEPAPQAVEQPVYNSMADLESAGYVTDEWGRWQQGYCAAYAVALVDAHPHLRFAVMGRTELGGGDASEGWSETHCFAHDDHYAYDSAGRHPLPYHDVRGQSDYVELDQDPEDWGYRDEFLDSDFADALAHAERHGIVGRQPVPLGGIVVHRLGAEEFAERFSPGEYQQSGAGWDEVADHPAFNEPNPFNPDRINDATWDEFLADVAANGIREPVEIDPYSEEVSSGHHRVVAALQSGVEIPFTFDTYPVGHPFHGTPDPEF